MPKRALGRILGGALGKAADDGDIYFEYLVGESISLEDGVVKKASKSISQGAGVRAMAESRTGYGYSDDITIENLALAARTAHAIASETNKSGAVAVGQAGAIPPRSLSGANLSRPMSQPRRRSISCCRSIASPAPTTLALRKVFASLGSTQKIILIATAEGLVVGDILPLVRLSVSCIAEDGSNRQTGTHGGGGRYEFSALLDGQPL